jgi:hypothetical protein
LGRIREDLETLTQNYTPPKPVFRKSYVYEVFVENILTAGRLNALLWRVIPVSFFPKEPSNIKLT